MKLTKFEHACFTVENNNQLIVIDPGGFTADFLVPDDVIAIVITHEHGDHFDKEKLQAIINKNPDAIIIAHESITSLLGNFTTHSVTVNEVMNVGNFELKLYVGEHAAIHSSIPAIANLGIMINNTIFYPGDAFILPQEHVQVLALPVGAPWLKISEVIDYLLAVKPEVAFPTHDAVLSEIGKKVPDNRIPPFAESVGAKYQRLTGPLEI